MQALDLREGLTGLFTFAQRDVDELWAHIGEAKAGEVLHDVLPSLVNSYGSAAATLAADWYDNQRESKAVRGNFRSIPADIKDSGTHALIGWALATANDDDSFKTLVLGGTQRRVRDFSRLTVVDSSLKDPGAHGWIRVGFGECDWCQQYLDGEVHYAEGYDFQAHDHCQCDAAPAF